MRHISALIIATLACACSSEESGGPTINEQGLAECHPVTVDVSLCDPAQVEFTLESTNPWYPLVPGLKTVLEGEDEGVSLRVERTVLAESREIAGVAVHVLEHKTFHDGEIHEIAYNFYVESVDGTVCYFGEDVEFYEGGALANTDGTWRVGVDGAKPGVIMPADPIMGASYYQEYAPGTALDQGRIAAIDLRTELDGVAHDTIQVIDTNPIDDEEACSPEEKRYARGIGEVRDVELNIVSVEHP